VLKPNVRSFVGDPIQPTQLMERGDLVVAPQYGIRIAVQARSMTNVARVVPKEGVLAVPYDLVIPEGAKNVALAKAYINFTLTQPVQAAMMQSLFATPSRLNVPVPSEIASLVTTDPAKLWFLDEDFAAAHQREWLDRYTRTVQG
jgi:putative spermidine/putrescine transport system substrate-binding protein